MLVRFSGANFSVSGDNKLYEAFKNSLRNNIGNFCSIVAGWAIGQSTDQTMASWKQVSLLSSSEPPHFTFALQRIQISFVSYYYL